MVLSALRPPLREDRARGSREDGENAVGPVPHKAGGYASEVESRGELNAQLADDWARERARIKSARLVELLCWEGIIVDDFPMPWREGTLPESRGSHPFIVLASSRNSF